MPDNLPAVPGTELETLNRGLAEAARDVDRLLSSVHRVVDSAEDDIERTSREIAAEMLANEEREWLEAIRDPRRLAAFVAERVSAMGLLCRHDFWGELKTLLPPGAQP